MGKIRSRPAGDILLDGPPAPLLVADLFAVRADRQQPLQLAHLLVQVQDSFGHAQAGGQQIGVERLGDEVVDPGVHRLQEVHLAPFGREHRDVGVVGPPGRPHPAAQFQPVHLGHHPVGDEHANLPTLPECLPCLLAVFGHHRLVTQFAQSRHQDLLVDLFIFCDEDIHRPLPPHSVPIRAAGAARSVPSRFSVPHPTGAPRPSSPARGSARAGRRVRTPPSATPAPRAAAAAGSPRSPEACR